MVGKLVHTEVRGGFNMRSGSYNRYRGPSMQWGIEYVATSAIDGKTSTVVDTFRRKCDAVTCLGSKWFAGWDGRGDLFVGFEQSSDRPVGYRGELS